MTINIRRATNVTATGRHVNKNSKPVFCITDGAVYASVSDAAESLKVDNSTMSCAVTGKSKTCKGKRYCFISDVMEYLDEISENLRIRNEKVVAYDAMVAKSEAAKNLEKHRARYEMLTIQREKEAAMIQELEALCNG